MNKKIAFKNIGLLKECESPENPGSLEKRVALTPSDVQKLVEYGCNVFVEEDVGLGVDFSNKEYSDAGAVIQDAELILSEKDLLIKFKGPSLESIPKMSPNTTLFCMAHVHSFPDRKLLLEENKIKVIAMEEILESPKFLSDEIILSKKAINDFFLSSNIPLDQLKVSFIGYHSRFDGAIRRAGNRNTKTLKILNENVTIQELEKYNALDERSVYFYDSNLFKDKEGIINFLSRLDVSLVDLAKYESLNGKNAIAEYRDTHPPFKLGMRKIQCLHETGMAGARYGYKLMIEESKKHVETQNIVATVIGYGNVGMGAIHECYKQGSKVINVLTRVTSKTGSIELYLKNSDLIINGAEQPIELRGKNYLIKTEHIGKFISEKSVVIDLVGGSETNRSAVEPVLKCSFLTDPFFIEGGVYFSSLWGWPMMGMMKESAIKYSSQIVDILIGDEKLIRGLDHLGNGVKRAIVV